MVAWSSNSDIRSCGSSAGLAARDGVMPPPPPPPPRITLPLPLPPGWVGVGDISSDGDSASRGVDVSAAPATVRVGPTCARCAGDCRFMARPRSSRFRSLCGT
eukprot:scaffold42217_cov59-Phaeocystis_antarctica.AAC.1